MMSMQGSELKAIRQALGRSQTEFAEQLGMTQTFVGMMERGDRPIEVRTALAARQLHNEMSPVSGSHEVIPMDGDVPIGEAQIIWDRYGEIDPPVRVVRLLGKDDDRYPSSAGMCNADWKAADTVGRTMRLLALFVELTVGDKIPAQEVHDAFSVIPEYRRIIHPSYFPEHVA